MKKLFEIEATIKTYVISDAWPKEDDIPDWIFLHLEDNTRPVSYLIREIKNLQRLPKESRSYRPYSENGNTKSCEEFFKQDNCNGKTVQIDGKKYKLTLIK